MLLSEQLREYLKYSTSNNSINEVDFRLLDLFEWISTQSQDVQDVVTLVLHLQHAFLVMYSPLYQQDPKEGDNDILIRVLEAQDRLGVDFTYPPQTKE